MSKRSAISAARALASHLDNPLPPQQEAEGLEPQQTEGLEPPQPRASSHLPATSMIDAMVATVDWYYAGHGFGECSPRAPAGSQPGVPKIRIRGADVRGTTPWEEDVVLAWDFVDEEDWPEGPPLAGGYLVVAKKAGTEWGLGHAWGMGREAVADFGIASPAFSSEPPPSPNPSGVIVESLRAEAERAREAAQRLRAEADALDDQAARLLEAAAFLEDPP